MYLHFEMFSANNLQNLISKSEPLASFDNSKRLNKYLKPSVSDVGTVTPWMPKNVAFENSFYKSVWIHIVKEADRSRIKR